MDNQEYQARQTLGTAFGRRNPRAHRPLREAAAKLLISDFLKLAEKQGLAQGLSDEQKEPYVAVTDTSSVRITTDGGGTIYMRLQSWGGGSSGTAKPVDLVFDCVTETLVGKEYDDEVTPTPGQLRPRVHALVAMARVAAQLMSESEGT